MLRIVLLTLAVAYLPGALLFRLPIGRRSHAALPAEERVFWQIVLSLVWSSVVGFALAASNSYRFERLLWMNAILCVTVAGLLRTRLRLGRDATRPTWTAIIPSGVALVGSLMVFDVPPAEYVMGGKDPGVYMNEGIQIAQRGGLVITDDLAGSIRPEHRELVYQRRNDPTYYSNRFMGFFVLNPDVGTVVGQFPHLYPTWIAIAYGVNGLSGARWVIGFWAVFGLVSVYFAGARAFGRAAAAAGAGLLAIHLLQVWYGRYPNAEMVMQPLVFAGTLAFIRSHTDGHRMLAPLAALLLGLAMFAHITAVFAVAAMVAALVVTRLEGQPVLAGFALPLAIGTLLAVVYLAVVLPPYFALPVTFIRYLGGLQLAALAAGAMAAIVVWRIGPRHWARWRTPALAAALVMAWAITCYAYFFRTPGGSLAPYDAAALRTFTLFYLSPLGLAAALVGLTVVTRLRFKDAAPLLALVLTFAVVFFYKIRIVPEHFWAGRRFVAVILPGLCLLAGAAAFTTSSTTKRSGPGFAVRMVLGIVIIAALGWHFWARTSRIRRHVEYAGLIPRLEQLAGSVGDEDLVLFESRGVADTHVLALPLAYIYARDVMVFAPSVPDGPLLREFVLWGRSRYKRVLFMGGGGMEMPRSISFTPLGGTRFWIPEYESLRNGYPRRVKLKEFEIGVYEMHPEPESRERFDLDIGEGDALYLRGFHSDERHPNGKPYRWTKRESSIDIRATLTEGRVTIWMGAGGRPPTAPPATVDVSLDGHRLGSAAVAAPVAPYDFVIPPETLQAIRQSPKAVRLELGVNTWNPGRLLAAKDDRDLGVIVERVLVR